jgi:hypothetical protein
MHSNSILGVWEIMQASRIGEHLGRECTKKAAAQGGAFWVIYVSLALFRVKKAKKPPNSRPKSSLSTIFVGL